MYKLNYKFLGRVHRNLTYAMEAKRKHKQILYKIKVIIKIEHIALINTGSEQCFFYDALSVLIIGNPRSISKKFKKTQFSWIICIYNGCLLLEK